MFARVVVLLIGFALMGASVDQFAERATQLASECEAPTLDDLRIIEAPVVFSAPGRTVVELEWRVVPDLGRLVVSTLFRPPPNLT